MKLLAGVLSLCSLGYLLTTTDFQHEFFDSNSPQNIELIKVMSPRIDKEQLAIERQWLEAKNLRADKNIKTKVVTATNEGNKLKQFALGYKTFTLLGIFNDPRQPFVLLKDDKNELMKLKKGELLTDNAKLVALDSSSIEFEQDNELIEFKLFERKK